MNEATRNQYLERIQNPTEIRPLTEKEAELLGRLLNTEPAIRALTIIHWKALQIPRELMNLNFADPQQASIATKAQGQIIGIQNAILELLELTETPSDESGEPENE